MSETGKILIGVWVGIAIGIASVLIILYGDVIFPIAFSLLFLTGFAPCFPATIVFLALLVILFLKLVKEDD